MKVYDPICQCRMSLESGKYSYGMAFGEIEIDEKIWIIVQWEGASFPSYCLSEDLYFLQEIKTPGLKSTDYVFPKPFVLSDCEGTFFGLWVKDTEILALVQWPDGRFDLIDPSKILVTETRWDE